jgi:hypothetical protein
LPDLLGLQMNQYSNRWGGENCVNHRRLFVQLYFYGLQIQIGRFLASGRYLKYAIERSVDARVALMKGV